MKRKHGQDRRIDFVFNVLLVIIGIICLYPLWFIVIASFSDPTEIALGNVILWPKGISLEGYKELLYHAEIWMGYKVSLFFLVFGSLMSMIVILPAAYALSRKELKGRRVLNFMFVISMYFSGGLIPTYMLHSWIGWTNTIWVLLIPQALVVSRLIVARSAFEAIPEALHESAQIDGATDFRFFFQFGLPLIKATMAVLFLFAAISWWNEYMQFLIYIRDPELQSLQVVMRDLINSFGKLQLEGMSLEQMMYEQRVHDLLKYVIVVIAAIPFVIIYPIVQRYFNQGVMIGAVKG